MLRYIVYENLVGIILYINISKYINKENVKNENKNKRFGAEYTGNL